MGISPVVQITEYVVYHRPTDQHWSFATLCQAINVRFSLFQGLNMACDVLKGQFEIVEHYANDNELQAPGDDNGYEQS